MKHAGVAKAPLVATDVRLTITVVNVSRNGHRKS